MCRISVSFCVLALRGSCLFHTQPFRKRGAAELRQQTSHHMGCASSVCSSTPTAAQVLPGQPCRGHPVALASHSATTRCVTPRVNSYHVAGRVLRLPRAASIEVNKELTDIHTACFPSPKIVDRVPGNISGEVSLDESALSGPRLARFCSACSSKSEPSPFDNKPGSLSSYSPRQLEAQENARCSPLIALGDCAC